MKRPAALVLALIALPVAAWAEDRIYSYEPASDAARTLAETGLSFEFARTLLGGARVRRVIQTGDQGAAAVRPASASELGVGGLKAALGTQSPVGDLYAIRPDQEDGQAFIGAVCPGAEHAWLLIGKLERFEDLAIQAVGRDKGAAGARLCASLAFSFRNDWTLPPRTPPRVRFSTGRPGR